MPDNPIVLQRLLKRGGGELEFYLLLKLESTNFYPWPHSCYRGFHFVVAMGYNNAGDIQALVVRVLFPMLLLPLIVLMLLLMLHMPGNIFLMFRL